MRGELPTITHPDYADYGVEKRRIRPRAYWFDMKNLVRKLLDVAREDVNVLYVADGNWCGWLMEFREEVDLEELKRNVWGVLILSERKVCFIGVTNA